MTEPEQPVVAQPLRAALERELNRPWTSIRTTAAQGLFDKAKASRTQEVTITAQQLAVLLPAIESSAVFLALRAALAVEAVRPETDIDESLDAAWAEAVAALPEGCDLALHKLVLDGWAEAVAGEVSVEAESPAAALQVLAERLRGERP